MNKKLIGWVLVGGATTITLASIGGVELSKKIRYDKKIAYFGKMSDEFNSKSKYLMDEEGWYFPKWEDNLTWKKQHTNLRVGEYKEDPHKKFPTPESFRDNCFKILKEEMNNFHPSHEKASECIRKRDWK